MSEHKIFVDAINNNTKVSKEDEEKLCIKNKSRIRKKKGMTTLVERVSKTFFIKFEEVKDITTYHGIIQLPSKKFIFNFFDELKRIYDKNPKHSTYAFVSFKFKEFWMPKTFIYREDYDDIIEGQVQDVIVNNEKYGDNNNACEAVVLSYKLIEYNSIKRWFNEPVKKLMEFKDFELFTAPDIEKSCEQQCIEYLGLTYDANKTFEENLKNKKVHYYLPIHNSMELVVLLNDLMSDCQENTTDCVNVVRIIKFNGHIGIITSINIERKFKIQERTPVKIDNTEFKDVFVDIESFTGEDNFQRPYLICWTTDSGVQHKVGLDCVAKFAYALRNMNHNMVVYAWFGSGYDFQYILVGLMKYFTKYRYIVKNNMIVYAEFKSKTKTIILKDPYLFLLCSLDKASKAFNVTTKGIFPHQIIKCFNDIYRRPDKWPIYTQEIKEMYENGTYSVKLEDIVTSVPNKERIIDKATDYCIVDVIAMKETWTRFKHLLSTNLGLSINPQTFTLSQLSMSLMESKLPNHVKLHVPSRENYEFIRQAIYGGRVIAKNGIYEEPILYADVVSLYPSAMRLLEHGHGMPSHTTTRSPDKHGIYKVKLVHKCDKEPDNYLEFVARRIDGKLRWNWFKEHVGYYHTYDLIIAEGEGFDIEIIEGIEYEKKGYIFNEYIDTLYKLKEDHSVCSCEEQPCPIRMIAKIALNGGGYGKFVQKPIDKEVYIVDKDVVAAECEKLVANEFGEIMIGDKLTQRPKFYELDCQEYDKMVVEREGTVNYSTQCGVSILSGSRYRLWNLCKKLGMPKIIYSDTDSIFVLESSVDSKKFNSFCGTNLGELDNELGDSIERMIIGGPKMYGYEYNNKAKLYCKGVPKKMLSLKQFEYMLDSPDNNLIYEFEILRRKLVGIEVKTLLKEIKQT